MCDFEGVLQLARNDAYIFGLEQSSSGMWEVQGEEWWDKNYFIYELLKFKKKKSDISSFFWFSCNLCPFQSSCFGFLLLIDPLCPSVTQCGPSPDSSFQFLNLSLSCPQPPVMIFPYVWRTQLYSYSFSLSCAFWESGLGTLFLAEGLQSTMRCLYMSQDSYTQILEKCVCEERWEKSQYGHNLERKCHHTWRYLNMSFIHCQGQ